MEAIELARRLARLGETADALRAYLLVLGGGGAPEEHLEAAAYLLDNGGDRHAAYTAFVRLYGAGHFRAEILPLLTKAFYEPALPALRARYERNRKALAAYPYLFRRDFLPFEELPAAFYPYGGGYVPFWRSEQAFGDYYDPDDPVVSRNFFKDLDKPVLADDVYSQYELEYLADNVRPSEWVGRENHIYLHYTDWGMFCAYLQALDLAPLLACGKLVFLIGDELAQYPIDFKARFGLDYSQYPLRPVSFREISRLIWHTQLMAHNGGDFFNEIFDGHPNLLWGDSILFDELEASIAAMRAQLGAQVAGMTDKDVLAAYYLHENEGNGALDPASRIVPAVFFQPHFTNPEYDVRELPDGRAALYSAAAEQLRASPLLTGFKYVKAFTPLRRPTGSHGGTMRFIWRQYDADVKARRPVKTIHDTVTERVLSRGYLRDPDDRLCRDSVIVRFEDGKLNPRATFTALTAFLDIPYTESMTYGSIKGDRNPYHMDAATYAGGFGTWSLDNPYDEFENDAERYFIEYFLRDVYAFYGYGFLCYDGAPVDEGKARELIRGFTTLDGFIRESHRRVCERLETPELSPEEREQLLRRMVDEHMERVGAQRLQTARLLLGAPRFVNRRGQPLQMTPLLKPDPALLEREIYH